ncbi:MAG: O-antigen ligase family protein [Clostridia bacterium]|nr:O-antigen ligase family protein [Clostridia bacterium]
MKNDAQKGRTVLSAITSVYLYVMLSVYMLYPGLGGYREITAQKWQAFLVLTGAYAVITVLIRLELALTGVYRLPTPSALWKSLGIPAKLVILYLLFTAVSAAVSEYPKTAVWGGGRCEGLVAVALYCLSFLFVSRYARPKRRMMWVFAAAMALNCILALIQLAGFNPLTLYPEGMNYYDANRLYAGEFLGTIGNVDILSAMLSLSVPAFAAFIIKSKNTAERCLLAAAAALCLVVLFRAFVAGGILGVFGALIISIPLYFKPGRARRRAFIAVIVFFAVIIAGTYAFGESSGGFIYEASRVMHGDFDDSFGSGRIYIWRSVIPLVAERPIFGGGPDTLGLRLDVAFERYDETLGITIRSAIDAAHCEYLNILVNQGILALAAYLSALIACAVRFVRRAHENPTALVCGCAALGYSIQAFFGISSPISTPYFWIALGFLCCAEEAFRNKNEKKGRERK